MVDNIYNLLRLSCSYVLTRIMDHAPMNWLKLYTLILCSDSIYIMFIYFTYRFVVKVTCSNTFNDFLISVASPLWLIIYNLLRLSCSYVLTRIMDHALMKCLQLYTCICVPIRSILCSFILHIALLLKLHVPIHLMIS